VSSAAKEYFKKAELAAKKGNFQYAIELYTQGLIMDPSPAEPRKMLHRACTLAIEEQGGNAQGGLKAKFKLAPIQANIKKLSVQKKPEEIVNEYEKAIRIAPQMSGSSSALPARSSNSSTKRLRSAHSKRCWSSTRAMSRSTAS